MLRFLAEVNSHRKKAKARSADKQHKKNDYTFRGESSQSELQNDARKQESVGNGPSERAGRIPHVFLETMSVESSIYTTPSKSTIQYYRQDSPQRQRFVDKAPSKSAQSIPQIQSLNHFLETMSIESSLYTTPSKSTIQYNRKDSPSSRWKSTQSSEEHGQDTQYTAEFAFEQCKLGGWQSPSNDEAAVTPSTEPTFSSLSPSISHCTEDITTNKVESHQVFRSGWVKHPIVSTYLHNVDYNPHLLVNERESTLEVHSATSSEISWNYDSQEYHEKISAAIASEDHNKVATFQGKTVLVHARSDMGNDEDSACSSVSSLCTSHNYQDTPRSNISSWSPICSPADHGIRQDVAESPNHCVYEAHEIDRVTPQYLSVSRENDSTDRENDISLASKYDDQLSFSELISRCEGESLAERLAPYSSSPSRRLFGRIIDTNSLNSLPNSSASHLSRSQNEKIESSSMSILSASNENKKKIVTPKMRNTSTIFSNHYNVMIPDDTEAQTLEPDSNTENDFPSVRSKFEAQSLEYGMEPPAPRRFTRTDLQGIAHVTQSEERSDCSSDDSYQSIVEHQSAGLSEVDYPIDTREVYADNSITGNRINNMTPRKLQIAKNEQKLQENKPIYEMNPEKLFHVEAQSAFSTNGGYSNDNLVEPDELSIDYLHQEAYMQNFGPSIGEKVGQLHTPIEYGISEHCKMSYCGPVDLDESIAASDDDDDQDNILDGSRDLLGRETLGQDCKKTLSSVVASERVQESGGLHSPGYFFLNQDELTRHEKWTGQHNPLQHFTNSEYDDSDGEEDDGNLHFDELHEKVMALKYRQEQSRFASINPHQVSKRYHDTIIDVVQPNTKAAVSENRNNTVFKTSGRRRKVKVWNFLIRILYNTGRKKKQSKKGYGDKEYHDLSSGSVDKFMPVSNDDSALDTTDFADVSLFPLNQLEQLEELTKNAFHDGLRDQMLERLEWERQRQRLAEVDKERDEWCEQMRTSILKERELERQRRLNGRRSDFGVPQTSFSQNESNERTELKRGGLIESHNIPQEGYLHYSTPRSYLCEKSRATRSTTTTRPLESLESFSVNSFLHTDLSFASPETTSSLNSPKMVSTIPPCTVCKGSERTHISLPCMHYSFCAECAEKLHGLEIPTCPICHTENISLRRVYT